MAYSHQYSVFLRNCLDLLHMRHDLWEEMAHDRSWAILWAYGCEPYEAVVLYLQDTLWVYDVIDE